MAHVIQKKSEQQERRLTKERIHRHFFLSTRERKSWKVTLLLSLVSSFFVSILDRYLKNKVNRSDSSVDIDQINPYAMIANDILPSFASVSTNQIEPQEEPTIIDLEHGSTSTSSSVSSSIRLTNTSNKRKIPSSCDVLPEPSFVFVNKLLFMLPQQFCES